MGDEITVYKVSGQHTGTFVVKVDDGGAGYEFDTSTLLTDGKLRVTAITDALSAPIASNSLVDVYTTDGICLFLRRPYSEVRSTLRPGTYVLVFGNTSRKIIVKKA